MAVLRGLCPYKYQTTLKLSSRYGYLLLVHPSPSPPEQSLPLKRHQTASNEPTDHKITILFMIVSTPDRSTIEQNYLQIKLNDLWKRGSYKTVALESGLKIYRTTLMKKSETASGRILQLEDYPSASDTHRSDIAACCTIRVTARATHAWVVYALRKMNKTTFYTSFYVLFN